MAPCIKIHKVFKPFFTSVIRIFRIYAAIGVVMRAVLGCKTFFDIIRQGVIDRSSVFHVESIHQTQGGPHAAHVIVNARREAVHHPTIALSSIIPSNGSLID